MAGGNKLAELFVDITIRGGARAQLLDMKEKIEATDRALANNAQKYQNVTSGKILQMNKLAERQMDLAKVDQRTYGSLPFGRFADKQAKADVETEIANKQKLVTLSQAEMRALSGKRGAELAQKTVQSERVKKQVEEIKNQQMMIAQHGRLGGTIMQMASMAKLAMGGPIGIAAGAVAAVGATAVATAGAASPVHSDMLSKSFTLLAAQIGTLLLPIIEDMAYALQIASDAVGWFGDKINDFLAVVPQWLKQGVDPTGVLGVNKEGALHRSQRQLDRPASMPASFEAFEQSWRRVQQEAASTGPLEQRILDVQMRNLEALNQIVTNTTPRSSPPSPQLPS